MLNSNQEIMRANHQTTQSQKQIKDSEMRQLVKEKTETVIKLIGFTLENFHQGHFCRLINWALSRPCQLKLLVKES